MKIAEFRRGLLALVAGVAVCSAGFAAADEVPRFKGKSVKVMTEDPNPEKEPGARALYRRLQHASKVACGVEASKKTRSASARSDAYRCYREVLTASVQKLDNELVTQFHEGR